MIVLSVAKHISSNNKDWINLSWSQSLRILKPRNCQKLIQLKHMNEGVPRQDEPENVKGPAHAKKA